MNGHITISRRSSNAEPDYFSILVKDDESEITFVEIKLEPATLALVLSGLGSQPCKITTRGLEHVGKVQERQSIEFESPKNKDVAKANAEAELEKRGLAVGGWILADSFNSQSSFFQKDGRPHARCTIHRWVEKTESN